MKFWSYFWPQVIEKTSSSFSQEIKIVEFLGRRSLRVNNMTQSGSIVEDIFRKILQSRTMRSWNKNYPIKVLILGFGTGTFAKLITKKYPRAKLIGIEVDKTIIDLGEKYFETNKINNLKLINNDAIKFVNSHYDTAQYHSKFDIIFVDLYKGEQIEAKIETSEFLEKARELLNNKGVIIFNRLNFSQHKKETEKFEDLLVKIFSQVTQMKSYSNIIFLGRK